MGRAEENERMRVCPGEGGAGGKRVFREETMARGEPRTERRRSGESGVVEQ